MDWICPIAPTAGGGIHVAVHLGLTAFIVVVGSLLLVRGWLEYRRAVAVPQPVRAPQRVAARRAFGRVDPRSNLNRDRAPAVAGQASAPAGSTT